MAPSRTQKGGAAIAAAVLVAAPLATQFEGYVAKAKPDPVGIPTYCYGETEKVDPARIYAKSECAALLRKRMAADYAPKILDCLPALVEPQRRYVFAALIDAAYNAGPVAVCKSRMAVSIRGGSWAGACQGFTGWYVTAKDRRTGVRKELPGLVRRRKAEAGVCLTPVGAPAVISIPQGQAPIAVPAPPAAPQRELTLWQRIWRFVAGR